MKKPIRSLPATIWSDLKAISKTVRTLRSHPAKTAYHCAIALLTGPFLGSSLIVWSFRTFVCWAWRKKGTFAIELTATVLGVYLALHYDNLQQEQLRIANLQQEQLRIANLQQEQEQLRIANLQQQQQHLDSLTIQKLHLVYLESQYNSTTLVKVLEAFSEGAPDTIRTDQAYTSLATAAINDQNIVSFLPHHKLTHLVSYIDSQEKLNHALRLYNDYLLGFLGIEEDAKNQKTLEIFLSNQEAFAENVRDGAASAAAMCYYLQLDFKIYFDKDTYDLEIIQSREQQVKKTKEGILSGTIPITTTK